MKKCILFLSKQYIIIFIVTSMFYSLLNIIEFDNATKHYSIYMLLQGSLYIIMVLFAKKRYQIHINSTKFQFNQKSVILLFITIFLAIGMHLFYTVEYYIYTIADINLPIGFGFTLSEFENIYHNSVLMCFIAGIFYPIIEEFFFRGILFNYFRKEVPLKNAMIWSCLIFSVFHGKFAPFVFFTSLLITYLYYIGESIIYPCIFHVINNSLSIVLGIKKVVGLNKDMTVLILVGGVIMMLSLFLLYKYTKSLKGTAATC